MSSSKRRERELNEDIFSNKIRKSTVNPNEEVTQFEDLSNDVILEVFDYLDASDIFYGFLSLNIRFDCLIKDSRLPIKLTRSASFDDMTNAHYQRLISTNRHRIISLYLKYDTSQLSYFTKLLTNYKLFNRLECIALEKIQYRRFEHLIPRLKILPCLFSLKIEVDDIGQNLTRLYQLISSLPVLRYNKVSVNKILALPILPVNTSQTSSLEHLVCNFPCEIGGLEAILAFTPQLKHLSCTSLTKFRPEDLKLPINLTHLRSVLIKDSNLSFNTFEALAKELFSPIEILHFVTSFDSTYFDPGRWERLILKNMPRLRIFNFKWSTSSISVAFPEPYLLNLNRFASSFWTERKWCFELQISRKILPVMEINCTIQPLKKQWYEVPMVSRQKNFDITVLGLCLKVEESQLSIYYPELENRIYLLADSIRFTSLHIDLYQFSMTNLLGYLHHFPNVDSLTITSKFSEANKIVSTEQSDMFRTVSTNNKITKLSIEQLTELDQVHLLMALCPNLHYFQLTCRNLSDAEWLIRYVLIKQNVNFVPNLCLICISLSNADEIITNRLKNLIYDVEHYKIFRICDKIYLQWNKTF